MPAGPPSPRATHQSSHLTGRSREQTQSVKQHHLQALPQIRFRTPVNWAQFLPVSPSLLHTEPTPATTPSHLPTLVPPALWTAVKTSLSGLCPAYPTTHHLHRPGPGSCRHLLARPLNRSSSVFLSPPAPPSSKIHPFSPLERDRIHLWLLLYGLSSQTRALDHSHQGKVQPP